MLLDMFWYTWGSGLAKYPMQVLGPGSRDHLLGVPGILYTPDLRHALRPDMHTGTKSQS